MESNGEIGSDGGGGGKERRVGLIFDERMCKHFAPNGEDHPECPDRIRVIWERLNSSGLAKRCIILKAKDAEDNHIALVHTKNHIDLIKNISSKNSEPKRKRIASKFNSIYFNEGSTEAAYLAAGSVIEAAEKVAKGELDSAFAIVRPPGHHAEEGEPMGFCLYNNVGIATSYLLNERRELGINKILIVDWDVHHGNGTQKMFYDDPRVLFFSVHRYDFGTFYPAGHDGSHVMTGEDAGAGHNINVPWEHGRCGDADYLAVWDHILIPVAKEFDPDMILISAGFDAAIGDPLGGCRISPYGYSIMLDKLMGFAGGKIVMALEGGYNLNSIESSARACVEVLLDEKPPNVVSEAYPFASTWRVIQEVRRALSTYWPILAVELPEKIISKTSQIEILSSDSDAEAEDITLNASEEVQTIEDVIQPFANLQVDSDSQVNMIKRTKTPASRKRKAEESASSAGTKKAAPASSSKRTESEVPKMTLSPRRSFKKLASSEPELTLTGFRTPPPAFPESVKSTMAELKRASGNVVRLLKEAVEKTEKLEEENLRLSHELSAGKAKMKELQQQVDDVKADLGIANGTKKELQQQVAAAKAQEADLASAQGAVFRALAERIFHSRKFSSLVSALIKPVSSRAVAEVLNEVAIDFPELNKEKYGYEEVDDESMLRIYGRALLKKTTNFPVVEALAGQRTLFSAEEVRKCTIDRDFEFVARLDQVAAELADNPLSPDVSEDEEEEEVGPEAFTPVQKNDGTN